MLEFLKQPGIYEIVWFLAGIFSYRILSKLITYGELYQCVVGFTADMLLISVLLTDKAQKYQELMYRQLESSGVKAEQIEVMRADDLKFNSIFRQGLYASLIDVYPKKYKWVLSSVDWDKLIAERRKEEK